MNSSVKGFGVIEGLFVVVVLGLLVLGGIWMINKNDDTDSNLQQTTMTEEPEQQIDTEQPTEQPEAINTSDWTIVDTKTYTMRLPDGWEFLHDTSRGTVASLVTTESGLLEYEPGVPAIILDLQEARDGYIEAFFSLRDDAATCSTSETVIDANISINGNSGVKCISSDTYKSESYKITNANGGHLQLGFATLAPDGIAQADTPERTELIEAMIGTLEFK